ncbi:MAG: CehA/McbA family metallohydrolase, partial [Turicibacter sp.]
DGKFTALYAYEMTWSAGTGKYGHMNTFNTPGFETRTNKLMDLKTYYAALKTQEQSISQFNHPGTTFGDFVDFGFYDAAIDEQISLIEVGNGEGPIRGSGHFPSYEYYTRALDKGWHVAPTNNQDNHKGLWGNSNTARTVIESDDLNRDSVYDALSERRVYSTEDENLRISYELNGSTLGSILGEQESLNFKISVQDPDATDKIDSISLITDGGRVAQSFTNINAQEKELTFTLAPDSSSTYYFVKVVQGDKDIAVTAPIWVGEKENVGISKVETSTNKVLVGEEVEVETVIFNNESSNIENVEVNYFLNGSEKPFATDTIVTISAADQGMSKAKVTLDKAGKNTIEVRVNLTINGATREFISRIEVSAVNPADVTRVMIDGSHANAYVLNGSYPGNMNSVTKIIQNNGGVVTINEKELTDETLNGFDLLLLTDPESKNPAMTYSDNELEAIKNFVARGGHLIMSSKADYGDAIGEYGNAAQGNAVLEAIGATTRFNDDQVLDNTENGGQAYRLYFDDYNKDSKYVAGIDFDGITSSQTNQKFSFYSGSSVIVNNPKTTEIVVKGHSTTESDDADKQGDNTPVNKGDVVALAVETLPNGSKVVVAGVTFFSDFEMDPSNEYSNPQIMLNLL